MRTKKRKKLKRPRISMLVPNGINERWSMGIVSDQLSNGRRFRTLNIVDDCSRECVGQVVDTSLSGQRVAGYLDELAESGVDYRRPSCAITARCLPARRCSSGAARRM